MTGVQTCALPISIHPDSYLSTHLLLLPRPPGRPGSWSSETRCSAPPFPSGRFLSSWPQNPTCNLRSRVTRPPPFTRTGSRVFSPLRSLPGTSRMMEHLQGTTGPRHPQKHQELQEGTPSGDHHGDLGDRGTGRAGTPLRPGRVDSGRGFCSPASNLPPADQPPALPLTPCVTCSDLRAGQAVLTDPHKEQEVVGRGGGDDCL